MFRYIFDARPKHGRCSRMDAGASEIQKLPTQAETSDEEETGGRHRLVSKAGLDRRIMAGLICAIDEAGFIVTVEADRREERDQTVAKIHGQTIRFGLTEKK